jgi:transcriptional regulator with XRE-family HTH domain
MTQTEKYSAAIRAVRALKGWTQAQLAVAMSRNVGTIVAIERGSSDPAPYVAAACEASGFSLSEFDLLCEVAINVARREAA